MIPRYAPLPKPKVVPLIKKPINLEIPPLTLGNSDLDKRFNEYNQSLTVRGKENIVYEFRDMVRDIYENVLGIDNKLLTSPLFMKISSMDFDNLNQSVAFRFLVLECNKVENEIAQTEKEIVKSIGFFKTIHKKLLNRRLRILKITLKELRRMVYVRYYYLVSINYVFNSINFEDNLRVQLGQNFDGFDFSTDEPFLLTTLEVLDDGNNRIIDIGSEVFKYYKRVY